MLSPSTDRFLHTASPKLRQRREELEARLNTLPGNYPTLIDGWLDNYRGREAAAGAVNTWLSAVQASLIQHGIQSGIHTWITPLNRIPERMLPVWPVPDWKIEYEPICTRRFINRARKGEPMFKQKGRDLCGTDARFIGLIATAVLCGAGLTADGAPNTPSNNLDDFVLVFDHIHHHMLTIARQQTSTIETIETRRQAGHREWLGRVPAPQLERPARRHQLDAEKIFDWAYEQTWPMSEMKTASLGTLLRKQKLWQVRKPILAHVQKQRTWAEDPALTAPARPTDKLPLTIPGEFMPLGETELPMDRAEFRSIELLARDLLTLGLWCLQAGIDSDTEEILNETLYALSAKLVSAHRPDTNITTAQLITLLESLSARR